MRLVGTAMLAEGTAGANLRLLRRRALIVVSGLHPESQGRRVGPLLVYMMGRLQDELLGTFQFDKVRRPPRCRLSNRFCISVIVLMRFGVQPDIFKRHQPYLMPLFSA
jgi:hypothetical protein